MTGKPSFFKRCRALWRRCNRVQKLDLILLSVGAVLLPLAFVGMWINGGFFAVVLMVLIFAAIALAADFLLSGKMTARDLLWMIWLNISGKD